MALPCSFSVALVLLSCHSLCCLACHLPDTHGLRNWRVLTLLGQMRRLSAGSCDHYTNDFAFPKELFDGQRLQEAQALSVVHVMTQKVFHLFCPDTSSAPWNMTLLEELCSGLSEQLDDLEACLEQGTGQKDHSSSQREDCRLRIKNYFQGIHDYLQDQKYSNCTWDCHLQVYVKHGATFSISRFMQGNLDSDI
uniref:Uncharacterized protein n=1 Tax=Canis lupus dingo TaxID=286419 RepID=A0A8C0KL82_CANLU